MQLIMFIISIFVTPSIVCTVASGSPICPRAKKDDLSSSLAYGIQTGSEKKWSKRAGFPELTRDPGIEDAIKEAKPFVYGTGFSVARSVYMGNPVTVKTYFGTTDPRAIQDELDKWKRIGALIGSMSGDLRSGPHDTEDRQLHIIFENSVPSLPEHVMFAAIKIAFNVQIGETPSDKFPAFLNHTLANPQELMWRRKPGDITWIATPIHFATKSPIDLVISRATRLTNGQSPFFISRTTYKNIQVTLKTYVGITGSRDAFRDSDKWRTNGRLVGTLVGLIPRHEFYALILGNPLPGISLSDMHLVISNTLGRNARGRDYANPQEFAWISWKQNTWTAIRIHFREQRAELQAVNPVDKAIDSAGEPFMGGDGFFISQTKYGDREVTLKTYIGTGSEKFLADGRNWRSIGRLVGSAVELTTWKCTTHRFARFYIILDNRVPLEMPLDNMHVAIANYLGENAQAHDFTNPQEFVWQLLHDTTWTATRIRFITRDPTQDPINEAIKSAFAHKAFAGGDDFSIYRTSYRGREVTLKTYFSATHSMEKIHAYCDHWMKIRLLIGATVDLTPPRTDNQVERFHMLLDNSIPLELSLEEAHAAIERAVGGTLEAADYANPQEYRWTKTDGHHSSVTWIARRIKFFPTP